MNVRIAILILCVACSNLFAQTEKPAKNERNSAISNGQATDELLKHLSAAEKYQIAGDLPGAAVENRAVLGIALERFANIAIEEGNYKTAVEVFNEALKYDDNASNRTNLAIAYLRQDLYEEALSEAKKAVSIDPNHIGGHYILGNIHYTKEDYEAALPSLKKVFVKAPDFEIARSWG